MLLSGAGSKKFNVGTVKSKMVETCGTPSQAFTFRGRITF